MERLTRAFTSLDLGHPLARVAFLLVDESWRRNQSSQSPKFAQNMQPFTLSGVRGAVNAGNEASVGSIVAGGIKIAAGIGGFLAGGPAGAAAGEESATAVTGS